MAIAEKSLIRSAGTVGAAFAANNLLPKATFIKPNYRGLVMFGLGMAAEILVDNEKVRAFGEGMTSFGALQTTGDLLLKTNKAKIGLAGLAGELAGAEDADYQDMSGQRKIANRPATDFNWHGALAGGESVNGIEADDLSGEDQELQGTEPEESMAGFSDNLL